MAEKRSGARLAPGELEMLGMLWREGGVTIAEAQRALDRPVGYMRLVRLKSLRLSKQSDW